MNEKFQHLQLIQSVIQRLGQNSFSLKGWCVTIVAALFALAAKDSNFNVAGVAMLPIVLFWFLDAYYMWKERQFRSLYNKVAKGDEIEHPYSMNINNETHCNYLRAYAGQTIWPFYSSMLVLVLLALWLGSTRPSIANELSNSKPAVTQPGPSTTQATSTISK